MKTLLLALFGAACLQSPLVQAGSGTKIEDSMPNSQKIRFCERVRDHALQTFYSRDKGRPMKLFDEDGSNGARITNVVIRRIYADPQIATPNKAEILGRAICNEMMGTKPEPE